jgi:hypothetical protein
LEHRRTHGVPPAADFERDSEAYSCTLGVPPPATAARSGGG